MADAKAKFRLEGENATEIAFKQAIAGSKDAADKMSKNFRSAFAGIAVAGAVLTAIGAHAVEMGDELNKAAIKAGVSGKAISELSYAAKLADVDISSLSTSLRFMQKFLSEAETGGAQQKVTLDALGLTFQKLKDLAPDQQFELLADRISKLKSPTDRARAATELFGRAGADLMPLFEQGAEGIRKAREEAQKLGLSFSDDQIKKLADTDDAVKRMKLSWEGLAAALTAKVAPALTAVFTALTPGMDQLNADIASLEEKLRTGKMYGGSLSDSQKDIIRKNLAELKRQRDLRDLVPFTPTAKRLGAGGNEEGAAPGYNNLEAIKALESVKVSVSRDNTLQDWLQDVEDDATRAERQFNELIAKVDELQKAGMLGSEAAERYKAAARQNLEDTFDLRPIEVRVHKIPEMLTPIQEKVREVASDINSALKDAFDQGGNFGKNFVKTLLASLRNKLIYQAIDELTSYLGKALEKAVSSSGAAKGGGNSWGSVIGSVLSSIFGGGKAEGGPLEQGKWYVAGEHGPEPIWGGGPGAYAMGYGRGGNSVVINNNIDARGATQDLIAQLPAVLRANNESVKSDILDTLNRRKFAFSR